MGKWVGIDCNENSENHGAGDEDQSRVLGLESVLLPNLVTSKKLFQLSDSQLNLSVKWG